MTTSDRLLGLFALFTPDHPEWSVEEAARKLDLTTSTTYRYFKSLADVRLIAAFTPGRYVLGPAIIELDRNMRMLDPLITTARPLMVELAAALPALHTVLLCRLYGSQVMCVHQESKNRPDYAVSYERGRPVPIYRGASSKIILAHLPPRIAKAIFEAHASDFSETGLGQDWEAVRTSLRLIRKDGYSITRSELDPGMQGLAVPIIGPDDNVMGSLSLVFSVDDRASMEGDAVIHQLVSTRHKVEAGLKLLAVQDQRANTLGASKAAKHKGHASKGSVR